MPPLSLDAYQLVALGQVFLRVCTNRVVVGTVNLLLLPVGPLVRGQVEASQNVAYRALGIRRHGTP